MDNKHHVSTSKPKNKNKLLKMLPKAMSFRHRDPPFSPGRDHHHINKAFFSAPGVSLVPKEARVRTNKNDVVLDEPTSPKVSCIGQIKLGKSKRPAGNKNKASASTIPKTTTVSSTREDEKSRLSKVKRFFSFSSATGGNTSKKSHPTAVSEPVTVVSTPAVPSLGQMKKFSSGREALGGFDWSVEIKREDKSH